MISATILASNVLLDVPVLLTTEETMRRLRFFGLSALVLALPVTDQSPAAGPADAAWSACIKAPKRACTLEQALHVAQSVQLVRRRAFALSSVAEAYVEAGLRPEGVATFERAIQAARSIADDFSRGEALASVAKGQATEGLKSEAAATLGDALRVALSIASQSDRDELLQSIACVHAQAGRFAKALAFLPSVNDEWRRSGVLIAVAESQAQAGLTAESNATFRRSAQEAQSARFWAIGRAGIVMSIAETQAKAGLAKEAAATFDQALRIAWSIKDEKSLA